MFQQFFEHGFKFSSFGKLKWVKNNLIWTQRTLAGFNSTGLGYWFHPAHWVRLTTQKLG